MDSSAELRCHEILFQYRMVLLVDTTSTESYRETLFQYKMVLLVDTTST